MFFSASQEFLMRVSLSESIARARPCAVEMTMVMLRSYLARHSANERVDGGFGAGVVPAGVGLGAGVVRVGVDLGERVGEAGAVGEGGGVVLVELAAVCCPPSSSPTIDPITARTTNTAQMVTRIFCHRLRRLHQAWSVPMMSPSVLHSYPRRTIETPEVKDY